MRWAALLVVASLVLAGCTGPMAGTTPSADGATPAAETPANDASVANATDGTDDPVVHAERPDPDGDRLGWEEGYWHDDPVDVTVGDGLNASERDRVVARAMARVEQIRGLEFDQSVDVIVRSRGNFSGSGGGGGLPLDTQRFDNAKFEALFLVGTRNSSLEQQSETRNRSVGGYYSPARDDIVIVSGSERPRFRGEGTLAHELVHALQDQHFGLATPVGTRDGYNGRNGLVEGDARRVQLTYQDRCGETWACIGPQSARGSQPGDSSGEQRPGEQSGTAGSGLHLGVYVLQYFPYSEGPGFVDALRERGGWEAVNDAFDAPPTTSKTVISPSLYGLFEPREVALADRTGDGWERVRPPGRPDYATLGQSGLTAMFAYTLYDDYNLSTVVRPGAFLNFEVGTQRLNWSDPFDYALPPVDGWTGDRLHVYHRGNRTGYVWRLTWTGADEAREFAAGYERLLQHWGGTERGGGVWTIPEGSPFTSAVHVERSGDAVTVVNAPTVDALDGVYGGAG